MGNTMIRMRDGLSHHDSMFRGEVIIGRGRKQVPYIDPYGKLTYRTEFEEVIDKGHNIVPIGGYQFAFSKLFNLGLDDESTLRVGDLNDEAPQMKIGISKSNYASPSYDAECSTIDGSLVVNPGVNISANNFIFGFMMGDGGSREDNMTAIAPNYKNRGLYRAVPFRMSNDGTVITDGKYYGKQSTIQGTGMTDSITSYYIKKFDDPSPRIVHCWATDTTGELSIVDDTVFASTSSTAIESYVEMNLSIAPEDGRGYFTSINASPRINEIALVTGWYNPTLGDYESIRLFTHYTRPSLVLSEGDSVEIVYRLYAR